MTSIFGRWDLVIEGVVNFPSWVEIKEDGGQFVGQVGSARPIREVTFPGENQVRWALPPQWEGRKDDLVFEGALQADNTLLGTTTLHDGQVVTWKGVRAPDFEVVTSPEFGAPIELTESMDAWKVRRKELSNFWTLTSEGLDNSAVGTDLVTQDVFSDFKLIAEYKYPEKSNSGIYLRGRYEFQILDDLGVDPHVGGSGAIYGFLAPSVNAVRPFGEWNEAEITLVGRTITVLLNGVKVIDQQEIPGITGGALDSEEGRPGPLFVQGDHGPVVFRRLSLHPRI